jgi:hypothetical protein
MNTKRTAFFVVVLAALAAWLAAAATSGVRPVRPVATAPATIDLRGEALAAEIERLHDHLRPTVAPERGRNLFQFSQPRERTAPVAAAATAAAALPPAPVAAPIEPAFKLIGLAEDAGTRTAILTSASQLYMVKDGDLVASTYRVTAISADAIELANIADGHVLRLALK